MAFLNNIHYVNFLEFPGKKNRNKIKIINVQVMVYSSDMELGEVSLVAF